MKETGNIYFETAEKSDPANREFVESGILRDDENWLYGIGDYSQIFIFSKRRLQNIYAHLLKAREERRQPSIAGVIKDGIKSGTSRGFTLPVSAALTICQKYIDLSTPTTGATLPNERITP